MVAIDVYRGDPDTVYAIGDSIIRSTDRGVHWETLQGRPWGTDVGELKVDPTNSQIVYISIISVGRIESNDAFMSTDGGRNWRFLFPGSVFPVHVIEIDPSDPKTVYVGVGPAHLFRTTNCGVSWDTLPEPPATYLTSLAIARTNDSILYAGYAGGGVFKSTDRGNSWNELPFITPLQAGPKLVVDPRDANIVYATILGYDTTQPGGVFKSTDGGQTWVEKNDGLRKQDREIFTITINPQNPDDIFIGAGSSDSSVSWVFRTTNSGEHWFSFSNGFPRVGGGVKSIAIDTANRRMYAGVTSWFDTQGVYILDSLTTGVNPIGPGLPQEFVLYQNYPNPFNPSTTIKYSLNSRQYVRLGVFNVLGEEIATLVDGRQEAGEHEVVWNAETIQSGVYFYRLTTEKNSIVTRRMVLMK
ncbi:MAG: T9SS type A sorting domain-containing protein [Ignavibacteria bacterium]|nr:T9SS type A sorting domain-containing protein [Ignavibacteria bacterium]